MSKEFISKELKNMQEEMNRIFDRIYVARNDVEEIHNERIYSKLLCDLFGQYYYTIRKYSYMVKGGICEKSFNSLPDFSLKELNDYIRKLNIELEKCISNINLRKENFIENNDLKLYKMANNVYSNYISLYDKVEELINYFK